MQLVLRLVVALGVVGALDLSTVQRVNESGAVYYTVDGARKHRVSFSHTRECVCA